MRRLVPLLAWAALAVSIAAADDSYRPTLADMADYRRAMSVGPGQKAEPVGFRDLWERPEQYKGRRVRVEGRVVVLFHKPPIGEFPALVETWLFDDDDNPFCLVSPEGKPGAVPKPGSRVSFVGSFLKRVQYGVAGEDRGRLAPLIVGGQPPSIAGLSTTAPPVRAAPDRKIMDWVVGLGLAAAACLMIALQHGRRPRPRQRPLETPPVWLSGDEPPSELDEPGDPYDAHSQDPP